MECKMRAAKLALSAALGLGAFGLSCAPSVAAIICNGGGDCWHSTETYAYPSDSEVVVHPDGWKWKSDEHYKWREHEGRGYWAHNDWKAF